MSSKVKPGDKMKRYFEETVRFALKHHPTLDEHAAIQCFDIANKKLYVSELQDNLKQIPVQKSNFDLSDDEAKKVVNMFITTLNAIANKATTITEATIIAKQAIEEYKVYETLSKSVRLYYEFYKYPKPQFKSDDGL